MTLTVLTDSQVNDILESLTIDELDDFRHVLSSALHEFSTGTDAGDGDVYQQPHRITTLHPGTKATSLYMPSCGPEGMGCKIVSLTSSAATEDPTVKPISPTGVVNLFRPDGSPMGLVHASTLTAFRTALGSACLLTRRNHVKTLTVFGSGSQAYWHVRLALLMRGSTIKHVHIINRRFSDSAGRILKKFTIIPADIKEREGWAHTKFSIITPTFHDFERLQKEQIRSADVIYCCTPSRQELFDASILTSHEGRKKGRLIVAVGSYTPEMRELPEGLLHLVTKPHEKHHRHFHKHADEGGVIVVDTLEGVLKEAGEIISAKISPHQMVELGELVMLHRLAIEESETDTTGSQTPASSEYEVSLNGDDKTPSMSSVYSDPLPRPASPSSPSLSNHSRKPSFPLPFRTRSGGSADTEKKKEDSLARWLRDGTVVYKSVGLGLMDLVVGMHVIKVASEKKIGTQIEGF
ncbi:NAD(P)-binding domain protein, partial [Metarhizium majus ARSEF 297]